MISTCRNGFTLIELLVVMAMIVLIMGAMTMSVSGAQERARVQKAVVEVKSITQAVMAAENEQDSSILDKFKSPQDLNYDNLKFLIGQAGQNSGGRPAPAFLMAALSAGNSLRDPWGTVYRVSVRSGQIDAARFSETKTGLVIPNLWSLNKSERVIYSGTAAGGGK